MVVTPHGFIALASLLTLCAAQAISNDPTCLFNGTHCACRENKIAGTCLRKESGGAGEGICTVATCNSGGYSCDCLGPNICKMDTCSSWVPKDGSISSHLQKDTKVACVKKTDSTCLTKVEIPVEYKMVQFGSSSLNNAAGTMFNMTAMPDTDDFLAKTYGKGDSWDHPETLQHRHITIRLYKSPTSGENMLCAIFNSYGLPNDGLGNYKIKSTVTGLNGQQLRWTFCDDRTECRGGPSSTLVTTHKGMFTHSDGWCVKPVESDSGPINVKFSNVNKIEGITFQLSDGSDESYYFYDGGDFGMTGTVDTNGLVTGGAIPDILFDLGGIRVPHPSDSLAP